MAIYNFTLNTFISTPTSTDKSIKIYDRYGVLKYTFSPDLSYYFYKNNFVFIKVENSDDIVLGFETNEEAISALGKLNSAKKIIVAQATSDISYYSKTELDEGQLNNLYYTSGDTNILFLNYSQTGHTHTLSSLSDVITPQINDGEVLAYSNGEWVNSSFTFDTSVFTSNYYSIDELSSSTVGVDIHWDNITNTPTTISGYGITDAALSVNTYTKDDFSGDTSYGGGVLDGRYYTKLDTYSIVDVDDILVDYFTSSQTNSIFFTSAQTQVLLDTKSNSSHTHLYSLSSLTDIDVSNVVYGDFLVYSGGTWINSGASFDINNFYTKSELDNGQLNTQYIPIDGTSGITGDLIPLTDGQVSLGSPTKQWKEIFVSGGTIYLDGVGMSVVNGSLSVGGEEIATTASTSNNYSLTSHTHINYSLTSHTHDDRYYTEIELNNGQLDNIYYRQTFIDGNYYNILESNRNFLSADTSFYSTGETLIEITNITDILSDEIDAHVSNNNNPHSVSFDLLTNTSHTHEDVWTKSQLSGDTPYGGGELDGRYYTKILSNARYFTKDETSDMLSEIMFSGSSAVYYTKGEVDSKLDEKSDIIHSHNLSDLSDVDSGVTDGQILSWDLSSSTWLGVDSVGGSGSFNLTVKDRDEFVQSGVTILNFIGTPTTLVKPLAGGGSQVNIWMPAPNYVDGFPGLSAPISRTTRYLSLNHPSSFRGDWDAGTTHSVTNSVPAKYVLSSNQLDKFAIVGPNINSYFEASFWYYVGNTSSDKVIKTHSIILDWNTGETLISGETSDIKIEILDIEMDVDRYKAWVRVTLEVLPYVIDGGRFGMTFTHNDVGNGIITKPISDVYFDEEGGTSNAPTIDTVTMIPVTEVVKYISGIKFYTTGQPWSFSATSIDNINDQSWKANNFTGNISDFAISTNITSTSLPSSTYWSNYNLEYDIDGVLYNRSLTINVSNYFRMGDATATGNIWDYSITDTETDILPVLIDTQTDTPSNLFEDFRGEDYRISNIDIPEGGSWTTSTSLLTNNGLQVIGGLPSVSKGGFLIYPQYDFSAYNPFGNPDYRNASGDRYYVRKFWADDGFNSQEGVFSFTWAGSQSSTGFDEQDMYNGDVEIDVNFWGDQDRWCKVYTNISTPSPASGSEAESYFVDGAVCRTGLANFGLGNHPTLNTTSNNKIKFTCGQKSINEVWIRVKIKSTQKSVKITSISLVNDGSSSGWN